MNAITLGKWTMKGKSNSKGKADGRQLSSDHARENALALLMVDCTPEALAEEIGASVGACRHYIARGHAPHEVIERLDFVRCGRNIAASTASIERQTGVKPFVR